MGACSHGVRLRRSCPCGHHVHPCPSDCQSHLYSQSPPYGCEPLVLAQRRFQSGTDRCSNSEPRAYLGRVPLHSAASRGSLASHGFRYDRAVLPGSSHPACHDMDRLQHFRILLYGCGACTCNCARVSSGSMEALMIRPEKGNPRSRSSHFASIRTTSERCNAGIVITPSCDIPSCQALVQGS